MGSFNRTQPQENVFLQYYVTVRGNAEEDSAV